MKLFGYRLIKEKEYQELKDRDYIKKAREYNCYIPNEYYEVQTIPKKILILDKKKAKQLKKRGYYE